MFPRPVQPVTGYTVAYRRSDPTLTTYASTSNNNDFYAGTPSAKRLIFYDGTNSDSTLAAYKTRVATRDAASISTDPAFINSTTPPYNLHIDPNSIVVDRKGTPITGVTTDIDGQSRHLTNPDIGADEYLPNPPDTVTLVSPANGAPSQPLDGQLVWNQVHLAQYYDVYLDTLTPPAWKRSSLQTDTVYNYTGLSPRTYYWQIVAWNDTNPVTKGQSSSSPIWSFSTIGTEITEKTMPTITFRFSIDVIPNPFTKFAILRYTVPISSKVSIKLYNATGRLIGTLINEHQNAGSYSLEIRNSTLEIPRGIYFLKYESNTNKSVMRSANERSEVVLKLIVQ